MNDIDICEATKADLPAILSLYAQPDYDNGRTLDMDAAERMFAGTTDYPFYRFYVARSGDTIIGVFSLLVMENLGHMGARSAIVEGVAVDPDRQGAGVGKRMMARALEIAREQGCYKLSLSSNLKRSRAHAFYDALGFEQHGVSFRIGLGRKESV